MNITINIDGHLNLVLENLIKKGVVKTKSEAIRLGLLGLEDKYKLNSSTYEKLMSALLSEKALAEDWLSKEDEEAWKDL